MRIDHIIYGVSDLSIAECRFADEYGLDAVGGGEHQEFGTCNRIIPVGAGQFIELLAVADENSRHPLAIALSAWVKRGDRPVGLCLRPGDLDQLARRLGTNITPAERRTPDGEVLRWRLAGVSAALGPERLPFFIDWQGAERRQDPQYAAAARTDGVAWVEYGGDAARLDAWIGAHELPLHVNDGEPGLQAIGLRRGSDTLVIR